jgi:hypothetical protein
MSEAGIGEPEPEPETAAEPDILGDGCRSILAHPWVEQWNSASPSERDRMRTEVCSAAISPAMRAPVWCAMLLVGGKRQRSVARGFPYAAYQRQSAGLSEVTLDQIEQDLPRTMPERPEFAAGYDPGTELGPLITPLRRVLSSLSARNPAVGYCQGLNFVVAVLLLVTLDEEAAFWLACVFTEDLVPPNFHGEGLCGTEVEWHVFDELLLSHNRELHRHFATAGMPLHIFATRWFITFFSSEPWPLESTQIIWGECARERPPW